tara:strand:- start:180 stop:359 length:180 start_codon:yes stop_codon:yes gene_type:complete
MNSSQPVKDPIQFAKDKALRVANQMEELRRARMSQPGDMADGQVPQDIKHKALTGELKV